ncbi:hypothetical protein BET03_06295 [Thermohalobacter berrensis]|uniref:Uncharacterized protein n=2 Tax=Thermohalobacter berrensis TaxID=99594 RepID=A0A419SVA0_9FIRM|nr:hypothetical protein BET03_06295 [Thermohalobacter berrensis]
MQREEMPERPMGPEMPQRPMRPDMPQPPIPTMPRTPQMPYMPTPYTPYYGYPGGRPPVVRPPQFEPEVDFEFEPGPPVTASTNYLQGYLRTLIGRFVRIDFLIGTNTVVDRSGTLLSVGIDHVVLREPESDDITIADLYSIKFVKVFY